MIDRMNVTDSQQYASVIAYGVHKRGKAALTCYRQEKYGTECKPRSLHAYPSTRITRDTPEGLAAFLDHEVVSVS
ncbi:MAG: hypothetical protein ACJARU_002256 [Congregibacter sp.]|jgi:hypothetical protein